MKKISGMIAGAGVVFLSAGFFYSLGAAARPALYAQAERPSPVLNTADFPAVFGGRDGRTLKKDSSGLIREVEFVAFPGTVFTVEDTIPGPGALVYKVRTAEYPSPPGGLFVDSRFVKISYSPLQARAKRVPPKEVILGRMLKNQGAAYIWGGNHSGGIPDLLRFYPPSGSISPADRDLWSLRGLDCSGLLYEAADGVTPRNTSDLVSFGRPVPVEGLTAGQIAQRLEPLDLIVWKGHVIIVLDKNRTIESCLTCSPGGGVTVRDLRTSLDEVMRTRTPVNLYPQNVPPGRKPFVVRRWYP